MIGANPVGLNGVGFDGEFENQRGSVVRLPFFCQLKSSRKAANIMICRVPATSAAELTKVGVVMESWVTESDIREEAIRFYRSKVSEYSTCKNSHNLGFAF